MAGFNGFVGQRNATGARSWDRRRRVGAPGANRQNQLAGLERWGYIFVTPDPAQPGKKSQKRNWRVRPTAIGRTAQETWRPLAGVIEDRWRERFGKDKIDALRKSLSAVLGQIDLALPEYLPILGYGLFSQILAEEAPASNPHTEQALAKMNLPALLAKVLLAFTIEFEFDWRISLPISANVLRLLDAKGVRIADLPRLSGISKEGVAFATGWLERRLAMPALSPIRIPGKAR